MYLHIQDQITINAINRIEERINASEYDFPFGFFLTFLKRLQHVHNKRIYTPDSRQKDSLREQRFSGGMVSHWKLYLYSQVIPKVSDLDRMSET